MKKPQTSNTITREHGFLRLEQRLGRVSYRYALDLTGTGHWYPLTHGNSERYRRRNIGYHEFVLLDTDADHADSGNAYFAVADNKVQQFEDALIQYSHVAGMSRAIRSQETPSVKTFIATKAATHGALGIFISSHIAEPLAILSEHATSIALGGITIGAAVYGAIQGLQDYRASRYVDSSRFPAIGIGEIGIEEFMEQVPVACEKLKRCLDSSATTTMRNVTERELLGRLQETSKPLIEHLRNELPDKAILYAGTEAT